jgi:stearoyl-CoA desaturase (delta-9 desaturase)
VNRASLSLDNFNWTAGIFIIGYHVALAIGLPFYFYYSTPGLGIVLTAVVLLFLTEIGIGGAYHRFYSHRCYTLSRPAELILLFLGTLAIQGSVLRWSHDHRLHHTYVDTDKDPYCIHKGFWYAHVLWIFEKSKPLDEKRVTDLLANPLVVFQHKYGGPLSILLNLAVALLAGWIFKDFLGAFVVVWWLRLLVSHHFTWFINSLAHYWGERTYSKEHTAVDNYVIAILTVGEGYHNYHHTFPSDYRNGVRWYHFDPTKWTIWMFSKLGMADNLRRFRSYKIKKRLLFEDRKLLMHTLRTRAHQKKDELEARTEALAKRLQEKLNQVGALGDQLDRLKKSGAQSSSRRALRREIKELTRSMRRDWQDWSQLCGMVLDAAPAAA